MTKKRRTDGYGRRIREAMERGPRPIGSVRGLHRRVEDHQAYKDLRGTSYGGIRQYVAGNIARPRTELLRALADVLGVTYDWLAYGDGAMTEEENLEQWEASKEMMMALGPEWPESEGPLRYQYYKRALDVKHDILHAITGATSPVEAWMPSWVSPAMEACRHLGVSAEELGEALRGPLDTLRLHWPTPTRPEQFRARDVYIHSMISVLLSLDPIEEDSDE